MIRSNLSRRGPQNLSPPRELERSRRHGCSLEERHHVEAAFLHPTYRLFYFSIAPDDLVEISLLLEIRVDVQVRTASIEVYEEHGFLDA